MIFKATASANLEPYSKRNAKNMPKFIAVGMPEPIR